MSSDCTDPAASAALPLPLSAGQSMVLCLPRHHQLWCLEGRVQAVQGPLLLGSVLHQSTHVLEAGQCLRADAVAGTDGLDGGALWLQLSSPDRQPAHLVLVAQPATDGWLRRLARLWPGSRAGRLATASIKAAARG